MAISITGSSSISHRVSTTITASPPATAPISTMASATLMARSSMWPARQNVQVAEAVPTLPCTLLVAMAETGSTPTASSAGTVISPPPPAIASTNPAASAATHNIATACGPNSANNAAPPRGRCYRPRWPPGPGRRGRPTPIDCQPRPTVATFAINGGKS